MTTPLKCAVIALSVSGRALAPDRENFGGKTDQKLDVYMAVLPASRHLNLHQNKFAE